MDDRNEHVILVDERDRETGTGPKLDVHRRGDLHRAFSVIIRNGGGLHLLQKRHAGKYHSGGLWTNACCGHPRPGEHVAAAAVRRLEEEMGIVCDLAALGLTRYRAALDRQMIEHELVHVFSGVYDGTVLPDASEADGYAWFSLDEIRRGMADEPHRFSVWEPIGHSQG
jgi:isopentenyl-diphosphate delta-isomerase